MFTLLHTGASRLVSGCCSDRNYIIIEQCWPIAYLGFNIGALGPVTSMSVLSCVKSCMCILQMCGVNLLGFQGSESDNLRRFFLTQKNIMIIVRVDVCC